MEYKVGTYLKDKRTRVIYKVVGKRPTGMIELQNIETNTQRFIDPKSIKDIMSLA